MCLESRGGSPKKAARWRISLGKVPECGNAQVAVLEMARQYALGRLKVDFLGFEI